MFSDVDNNAIAYHLVDLVLICNDAIILNGTKLAGQILHEVHAFN